MEYAVLGWPEDEPQLRLDHREFSYAGKFVMSNTGKAVARTDRSEDATGESEGRDVAATSDDGAGPSASEGQDATDDVVAAISFSEDRTDPGTTWLRYVTVRADRRGEGVGARLARFVTARLHDRGYDRVQIAVNNAFAYHALYKAGFAYTGERTGLAELVLAHPAERTTDDYQSGLDVFRERGQADADGARTHDELAPEERAFLAAKEGEPPPDVVPVPA